MSKRCCKGEDRFLCFRTPCSLLNQWFRLVNFAGIVNWRIWKWINDQVNLETHQPLVDLLKAKSALWAALKLFSVCRPPPFFLDTSIWGPQEIWEVGRLPAERLRKPLPFLFFLVGSGPRCCDRPRNKSSPFSVGKKGGAKDHVNFRGVSSGFCSFAVFFFEHRKGFFAMGMNPPQR